MKIDILTKDDLEKFKFELLEEIKTLLNIKPYKKWLTSKDVQDILSCSASSLQNLRIRGEITSVKLGGRLYYEAMQFNDLGVKAQ